MVHSCLAPLAASRKSILLSHQSLGRTQHFGFKEESPMPPTLLSLFGADNQQTWNFLNTGIFDQK